MPICTVYLLHISSDIPTFLSALSAAFPDAASRPLVVSRVIRWMIFPELISTDVLLRQVPKWDILLITRGNEPLPGSIAMHIKRSFSVQAGIPSGLVNNFSETNDRLLHPKKSDIPALTGALDKPRIAKSGQKLELTEDTKKFIDQWDPEDTQGAVSMLNLLAFKPNMHAEYLKYGKAFADSIGSRRGGTAKLVGRVVKGEDEKAYGWDEIALAHYPSIRHFADMAASDDYQDVNMKYRVPSLKDTCILCTSELDWPEGSNPNKSKL